MAKPPARRIPSDDFVITVDGTEYTPHEGEWIEVLSGFTVGDMQDGTRFAKLLDDRASIGDDETAALTEWAQRADAVLTDLARSIDSRMVAWAWTDARSRPLPAPSPAVIASLTWEELAYLLKAVRGQIETDRKNGSAPLPTTTSAIASRKRRKS